MSAPGDRTRLARVAAVLALALLASCTRPGPRAHGTAEVSWDGPDGGQWSGGCTYSVLTRWSTSLPHIIRIEEEQGERSVVLQSRRSFPEGRTDIPSTSGQEIQGLAMDGASVIGSLQGTLTVSVVADTTRVDFDGQRMHRDTVPLRARCRLGPSPRAP